MAEAVAKPPPSMNDRLEEMIRQLDRRMGGLKSERDTQGWLTEWRDLCDYILPQRGEFLMTDRNRPRRNRTILDGIATRSANILASGLCNGMSSRSRAWFRLLTEDPELMDSAEVRKWLAKCQSLMERIFHQSNFYDAILQVYLELGVFGTACMLVLEDFKDIVRFETMTIGEYYLAVDNRNVANTAFREFEMTVYQMVSEFTYEGVPKKVRDEYDKGGASLDRPFNVRHYVGPNTWRRQDKGPRNDARNMAFASIYWMPNCDEKGHVLRWVGFEEESMVAPRWSVRGNQTYGTSPGMEALADLKQLMSETKHKGEVTAKLAKPPLKASGNFAQVIVDQLPGAINHLPDGTGMLEPIYGNMGYLATGLNAIRQDIGDVQGRIERAFYVDVILAITQMDGVQPRNERELLERKDEKLTIIGPVIESFQRDALEKIIDRVWAIGNRPILAGGRPYFPPPPKEIAGKPIKIDFISPMALAVKQASVSNIERTLGMVGNLSPIFPEARDKVDVDEAIERYADIQAVPPSIIRSDEDVAKIRAARAQKEQMAEMAAMAGPAKDGAAAAEVLARLGQQAVRNGA